MMIDSPLLVRRYVIYEYIILVGHAYLKLENSMAHWEEWGKRKKESKRPRKGREEDKLNREKHCYD